MSNETAIQEAIIAHLDASFAQPLVEQAVPDSKTVLRNLVGDIDPYIAYNFGDLQQGVAYSMAGPRGDDYVMPIYTQVIAPDPGIARRLGNKLRDIMLGEDFPWTGSIRKRPGGGMFPLVASNGATEAYIVPASFGVLIQFDT